MKIHEFQAKDIFRSYGIPTLEGGVAKTAEDAMRVAERLTSAVVVVKSQVHIGGRGKGRFLEHGEQGPRGVNVVRIPESGDRGVVRDLAAKMLGSTLRTQQGEERVQCLYIEQGCDIARELYAAIAVDRAAGGAVLMASTEGGMDVEEVAAHHPEKILRERIDPVFGLLPFQARRLAIRLGLPDEQAHRASRFLIMLAKLFDELDASIVEVNPLVITKAGEIIPLDGKVAFDENALFRHQGIVDRYGGYGDDDPVELEAKEHGLSYVKLDGEIGCLVNGAGLAMATMDIIKHSGAAPANFLDVGGSADEKRVTAAFRIILKDPNVKAILVNIFGGIVHCDMIAKGVLGAIRAVGLAVPLVVRLEGTSSEKGRALLAESGLAVITATSMSDAAEKVVAAVRARR